MSRIKALYAWVAIHEGKESVLSAALPNGAIQLISPNLDVAEGFRDLAQEFVDEHGMQIELVRFGARETVARLRTKGEGGVVPLKAKA